MAKRFVKDPKRCQLTIYVFLGMPDGQANIELIEFYTPSDEKEIQRQAANTLGIRHIAFVVEDVEDIEAVVAKLKRVSNFVGLATESTETLEVFLNELSDLCGETAISRSFLDTPKLKKKGQEIFSEVQHYEDSYKLCYVRGPEGIILELAEPIK